MSVIFPDEKRMSKDDLIVFKKDLTELFYRDPLDSEEIKYIKTMIYKLEGYLLLADRKNYFEYFHLFEDLNFLDLLNAYLDKKIQQISFCILECIYLLSTNINNTGFIFHIYNTKYATEIPGQKMNIIDKIISIDAKKREEFLTYQINFMKSLTLKLNIDCINFFYDKNINQFPIFNKAFSLYNHNDSMIRSVVKNIILTITKINEPNLRKFLIAFPNSIYYPNLIFQLKNIIVKLSLLNINQNNFFNKLRNIHDDLIDSMYYICDLFLLNIDSITFILMNCLFNEIILPLFKTIISKKEEKISILNAIYFLMLIIHLIKNKFVIQVISYILFEEYISKKLLDRIKEYEFNAINSNFINKIDSLIVNNQSADVNDKEWKYISQYMLDDIGMDLSTNVIDKNNIYYLLKNIMKENQKIGNVGNIKNTENVNLEKGCMVKNEIFENVQLLFTSRDDCIIMALNLLVNSVITFFIQEEIKKNNNSSKNENHIDKNDYNKNSNKLDNNLKNGIKNIKNDMDNLNTNTNNKINVIENNNNNNVCDYNPLNNNSFFVFPNNNNKNLFELLTKLITGQKNFRGCTNEVILNNISLLFDFYKIKLSNNKDIITQLFSIICSLLYCEVTKLQLKIKEEKTLSRYSKILSTKAFEIYNEPINKKLNDLKVSPYVFIPLIYIDNDEEIPSKFKEDKNSKQIFKTLMLNIFILDKKFSEIIDEKGKSNYLKINPVRLQTNIFNEGKEYMSEDLGDDQDNCHIINFKNNHKVLKGRLILTMDSLYFGQILSDKFDNRAKVKILKKFPLRFLLIQIPKSNFYNEENTLLEISDNSFEEVDFVLEGGKKTGVTSVLIDCFNPDNTARVNNFLLQQRNNAIFIEQSIFDSYIEDIIKKIEKFNNKKS